MKAVYTRIILSAALGLALTAPVYAQSGTAPGSINVPGGSNTTKASTKTPAHAKKSSLDNGTTKSTGAGGGGSSNGSPDNSMNAGGMAGGSTVSQQPRS